jgi:hypothetical protein
MKIQDALDPQEVLAVPAPQPPEPVREGGPVERLVEGEAEGADAGVVRAVAVVMAVPVPVMVRLVGALADPGLHVR